MTLLLNLDVSNPVLGLKYILNLNECSCIFQFIKQIEVKR